MTTTTPRREGNMSVIECPKCGSTNTFLVGPESMTFTGTDLVRTSERWMCLESHDLGGTPYIFSIDKETTVTEQRRNELKAKGEITPSMIDGAVQVSPGHRAWMKNAMLNRELRDHPYDQGFKGDAPVTTINAAIRTLPCPNCLEQTSCIETEEGWKCSVCMKPVPLVELSTSIPMDKQIRRDVLVDGKWAEEKLPGSVAYSMLPDHDPMLDALEYQHSEDPQANEPDLSGMVSIRYDNVGDANPFEAAAEAAIFYRKMESLLGEEASDAVIRKLATEVATGPQDKGDGPCALQWALPAKELRSLLASLLSTRLRLRTARSLLRRMHALHLTDAHTGPGQVQWETAEWLRKEDRRMAPEVPQQT
jgi:hypothetical protein